MKRVAQNALNVEVQNVRDIVYNYETKYPQGFLSTEVEALLKENFPNITLEMFNDKFGINTVMLSPVPSEGTILYHIDVYHAILQIIQKRGPRMEEWD